MNIQAESLSQLNPEPLKSEDNLEGDIQVFLSSYGNDTF